MLLCKFFRFSEAMDKMVSLDSGCRAGFFQGYASAFVHVVL